MLKNGRFDVIASNTNSGAGGNTAVTLRPANDSEIYLVKFLSTYHNDNTAARALSISLTDGTTTLTYSDGSTYANGIYRPVLADLGVYNELILTRGLYLTVTWLALAAGKVAYLDAAVEVLSGCWGYDLEI